MIDGNANQFIESLFFEDAYILYDGKKYFINGCSCNFDDNHEIINVKLEVYNIDEGCTVFSVIKPTQTECVTAFEDAPIFNGKTFWDVEQEIQWVDD